MSKLRGEQFCRRGGGKPDRALGAHSWATGNPCTRDWARFSSLRFSLLVKHSCPEWLGPRSGVSEERKVKKFNQNGMHAKLLAQQTNKSKKLKGPAKALTGAKLSLHFFLTKATSLKTSSTKWCDPDLFHFILSFYASFPLFFITISSNTSAARGHENPCLLVPIHANATTSTPWKEKKNKKTLQK